MIDDWRADMLAAGGLGAVGDTGEDVVGREVGILAQDVLRAHAAG
jgi:hypothetical protein